MHFFFISFKYSDAQRHYLQHPAPLSLLWREVWRGQWGRLLDSEVRRCRGVLWPFVQPLWRLLGPPFRMSWMCCTIKLMATERGNGKFVKDLKMLCGRGVLFVSLECEHVFVLPRTGKLKHNPKDKLNMLVICRLRCHNSNHWGLTKIICSSWNNDICILLRLVEIRNVLMIKVPNTAAQKYYNMEQFFILNKYKHTALSSGQILEWQ